MNRGYFSFSFSIFSGDFDTILQCIPWPMLLIEDRGLGTNTCAAYQTLPVM